MNKSLRLLVLLIAVAPSVALASPERISAILAAQRQHGYPAPQAAIEQLVDVEEDAGPGTPLALRLKYHAALAALYIAAEREPQMRAHLQVLARMASDEKCLPCGQYLLVREAGWALRRQEFNTLRPLMARVEELPALADPALEQSVSYLRSLASDAMGDHTRAIEWGIKAVEQAVAADNPAEQVRALNLLVLANAGRRDLTRAHGFAREGYALAERIGFTYMMAYLRGNQAWIYSLQGDTAHQLQSLEEALAITRSHPGLGDAELVNLINLGEYHLLQKDYRAAISVSQQAIDLSGKQNKLTSQAIVMTTLADAQLGLGETEKSVATLEQATAQLTRLGAKTPLIDGLRSLSLAYEKAGRQRECVAVLRRIITLKDEATSRERDRTISEAQVKFSAERKDREIERLSLESARRQAEVSARTWQQRLWAATAVALALAAALLAQAIARTRARNRLLETSNAALSDQSVHDPLTGAHNRRHCNALMGQQEALLAGRSRDRRYLPSVGLILIDVDNFKHINDSVGHAAGDAVLVELSRRLQTLVRERDAVVRWGGDEFVLILPGTPPEGLGVLIARALEAIGAAPVTVDGRTVRVNVSAGGVAYPMFAGQHWEDALRFADLAMYQAKSRGRNQAIWIGEIASAVTAEMIGSDLAQAEQAGHLRLHAIGTQRDHAIQPETSLENT